MKDLKAVIMAGGRGTRLMPISALSPKPMTRLMGLPLLEHIVELLRYNGFTELCMTLGHMPEQIKKYFGNGEKFGVSIEYRTEDRPLGTAGGVRAASDFVGKEAFLVISGDAACDFDLKRLAAIHAEEEADVTMALFRHPEPLRYGTVLVSDSLEIRGFIEKPSWGRVVTDMVNTGIYVISPRVMPLIPEGETYDFARDLFPRLMKDKYKMIGVPMDGYWCDIGDAQSYLRCCMDAIDGSIKLRKTASGEWTQNGSAYICTGAKIDRSAIITHSIIHSGGKVGANSRITDSVIDGCEIGSGCEIDGTVACRGAVLEDGSVTKNGDVAASFDAAPPAPPREEHKSPRHRKSGLCREVACPERAALMRGLSDLLWEAGADFSDGITLSDGGCRVHICPMEDESAISMEASGGKGKDRIAALKKYCEMAERLADKTDKETEL